MHAVPHTVEEADRTSAGESWRLTRTGLDPARQARDETLFALANGSLGVRAGLEEAVDAGSGCFIAGVFERNPIHYHERFRGFALNTDTRVPVADGSRIGLWLGDVRVDPAQVQWLDFSRELDFARGLLTRRARLRTPDGATLELHAERIVPLDAQRTGCDLLAVRLRVTSIDYNGPLTLAPAIEGGHRATGQGDDPRIGAAGSHGLLATGASADASHARYAQRSHDGGVHVLCAQALQMPVADVALAFADAEANDDGVRQRYTAQLQPGASVAIEKFVAYAHGDAPGGLQGRVDAALQIATAAGFDTIAAQQAQALADFWNDAVLSIDGDAASEQALRFNLFHLWQSAGRNGIDGTAAKGLTGEGYEGHCFWDTEVFVLPVMAFTAPEVARAMLMFRHRTLDGARAHARAMNHERGALYPWRSIDGSECSAHYPSGSAAYHINAAIAYGTGLYMDATDDVDFLCDAGAEMLLETARIWPQVGHFNSRRGGAFCIHEVTGPDEYTAMVDNNYYTNRMAQQHLRCAVAAWRRLQGERPEPAAALAARIGLQEPEIELWQRAADAMYLPFDKALGIHAQDDGFLDKPRWDFNRPRGEHRPLLLDHHPLTLYRHQVCKQADVVMALVLAGDGIDASIKRADFDYYEAVTTHDSTLSAPVFGILASEVGYPDKAWRYFSDALRVDLDDLHHNTDHGVHMAAMAGSWLGLVQGFAGLRVVDGQLRFAPNLPAAWQGYGFNLRWRGRRLRIDVRGGKATYTLVAGEPLQIGHHGVEVILAANTSQRLPLGAKGGAA